MASEQQTLGRRRLLLYNGKKFKSLDLETLSFGDKSSVRKFSCPFKKLRNVDILCSGNGLVCATLDYEKNFYVWNPTTGLYKQLPDPPVLSKPYEVIYHGCGYLSATDDFKFLVARIEEEEDEEEDEDEEEMKEEVDIFSWRAQAWKRIQVPKEKSIGRGGTLLNETLHWLCEGRNNDILFAFDLAKEEFRRVPLPILDEHGKLFNGIRVSLVGCLCLYRFLNAEYLTENCSFIDLWVMREYNVGDSWTKLCRLKFSNVPKRVLYLNPLLVMEDSIVVRKRAGTIHAEGIRIGYNGEVLATNVVKDGSCYEMEYEESLLWLDDYDGVVEDVKAKRLKTQH
jgi:F-box interacting protein